MESILSKGSVVACLPGARIEHVTERVEKITGRENGGTVLVHVRMNNAGKEGTTAIVEKYMNILKNMKQAMSYYQEFYHSVWKQDTRRQTFGTDGSERDGEVPLPGRGSGIRGFVGQLFGERRNVCER